MRFKTREGSHVESSLGAHLSNSLLLGRFPEGKVDWEKYARQYDAVTVEIKKAYQQVMGLPLDGKLAGKLDYQNWRLVCDLGAGTGNLSIPLARRYPHLTVAHVDSDSAFNSIAQTKARGTGVSNVEFHLGDAEDVGKIQKKHGKPFDAVFMIHALYAMRSKEDMDKPQRVLRAVYESLANGGCLWITDIEREMSMAKLIADGLLSGIRKHGPRRTIALFKEMDQAKYQNANVIRHQRDGTYITQRVEGLVAMICKAGFKESNTVLKSGFEYYHGYDNIVVVRK